MKSVRTQIFYGVQRKDLDTYGPETQAHFVHVGQGIYRSKGSGFLDSYSPGIAEITMV